jgi:hypothetical protein
MAHEARLKLSIARGVVQTANLTSRLQASGALIDGDSSELTVAGGGFGVHAIKVVIGEGKHNVGIRGSDTASDGSQSNSNVGTIRHVFSSKDLSSIHREQSAASDTETFMYGVSHVPSLQV